MNIKVVFKNSLMIAENWFIFSNPSAFVCKLTVVIPSLGIILQKPHWQATSQVYVWGQFIFIALAYLSLTSCFLQDDFTVTYVFNQF